MLFVFHIVSVGQSIHYFISQCEQVNSMFLADIYGTKEGEEDKEDRQTLQVWQM